MCSEVRLLGFWTVPDFNSELLDHASTACNRYSVSPKQPAHFRSVPPKNPIITQIINVKSSESLVGSSGSDDGNGERCLSIGSSGNSSSGLN